METKLKQERYVYSIRFL